MAITIGGHIYRNLQEQVYDNLDRIEELEQDVQDLDDNKMTNPMTASGDLIVGGTGGYPNRIQRGSANQVITTDGVTVGWGKVNKNGISSSGEASGKVLTADGSGNASWEAIEGTDIKATGVTADKVLTANGSGGAAWGYVDVYGEDVLSTGAAAGKVLTADGDDGSNWADINGTSIKSIGQTSGKVLTADGSGGAGWENVPQNFTGSVSGISLVISIGTNQLSSSIGSNGQFLTWNNGPVWSTVPQAEDEGV